jgi:hypothetical protein
MRLMRRLRLLNVTTDVRNNLPKKCPVAGMKAKAMPMDDGLHDAARMHIGTKSPTTQTEESID